MGRDKLVRQRLAADNLPCTMSIDNDLELYPNSPLRDVACEIRFPGEMEVETNRHVFWNKIRERYCDILVPKAQLDIAPALQHYRFRDSQRQRLLGVALNRFAFSESEYSGHESFIGEFFSLADTFCSCYPGLTKLNRVGWRYINVIPYVREGAFVPVAKFLKAELSIPQPVFPECSGFDIRISAHQSPKVNVRIASTAHPEYAILLDIDVVFEEQAIPFDDYKGRVQAAREVGRHQFEELITDDYRQYLRGDEL